MNMNFDNMKNVLNMAENLRGKSAIDVLSENNPQLKEMQNAMQNPADLMTKMGVNMGDNFGGMNVANMANMMKNMGGMGGNMGGNFSGNNRNQNPRNMRKFYGLAPIAGFATAEIVYCLNKYLAEVKG